MRKCSIFFLFLSIFIIGCKKENLKPKEISYPVMIAKAVQQDTPIYIDAIGNILSHEVVDLKAQATGIIVKINFNEGDRVKEGQLLYTIDERSYKAALDEAKANLAKDEASLKLAELTVKRYETLVEKDYVSKLNFDQYATAVELSKAQIEIDKARVDAAQINLNYCKISSPIDGKIGQRNIHVGNLIVANNTQTLATIRQFTPIDVSFNISQRDFALLQSYTKSEQIPFKVILPQDPKTPRSGMVYFIDNALSQTTGTIALRGSISNEDEMFWPGEFVKIKLQINLKKDAVLVPEECVKVGQSGHYVFIYHPNESNVEYRDVIIGDRTDGFVIIEKGIKPNEAIIREGQLNLRQGTKVYLQ